MNNTRQIEWSRLKKEQIRKMVEPSIEKTTELLMAKMDALGRAEGMYDVLVDIYAPSLIMPRSHEKKSRLEIDANAVSEIDNYREKMIGELDEAINEIRLLGGARPLTDKQVEILRDRFEEDSKVHLIEFNEVLSKAREEFTKAETYLELLGRADQAINTLQGLTKGLGPHLKEYLKGDKLLLRDGM